MFNIALGKYTILKKKKKGQFSVGIQKYFYWNLRESLKVTTDTMKYKYLKNGRVEFSSNKIIIKHVKIMMMDFPTM